MKEDRKPHTERKKDRQTNRSADRQTEKETLGQREALS